MVVESIRIIRLFLTSDTRIEISEQFFLLSRRQKSLAITGLDRHTCETNTSEYRSHKCNGLSLLKDSSLLLVTNCTSSSFKILF